MTSLVAYNNRFNDSDASTVVFNDVGGDFSSAQPLENMAKKQLPLFAEFDGPSCELDIQAVLDSSESAPTAETFSADVFALLGHTLTDGMEVEFLDGSSSLGTVTVANYTGLAQHAVLVLDSAVSLDTLTVSVTGGGSGESYRIGSVWAGPSFRVGFGIEDFSIDMRSLSDQAWSSATGYTNERDSQQAVSVRFPHMTRAKARGPSWPNWQAITSTTGKHSPILIVPDTTELAHTVYGLVESFAPTRLLPMPQASGWRGGVNVLEMK